MTFIPTNQQHQSTQVTKSKKKTLTNDQNNLTKRPHCRCTWTVQSYSPGGANVHFHLIHASLDPPEPQPKRHLDQFNHFYAAHGSKSLYFTKERPFPLKIAALCFGIWTPSKTWFPGPTRLHIPNSISIGSAIFARLTIVSDRPIDRLTDHATLSVAIGRI